MVVCREAPLPRSRLIGPEVFAEGFAEGLVEVRAEVLVEAVVREGGRGSCSSVVSGYPDVGTSVQERSKTVSEEGGGNCEELDAAMKCSHLCS